MLIEFKVANFRSIREMQTLSLVAANTDKELPENLIDTALPGLSGMKFLKGAALYGANASGKSNVLEALYFIANFITTSATTLEPGAQTGTQPFKLDGNSSERPSEFELTFVVDGVRYVYSVSLTKKRIVEEYLDAYPKGSPQHWFRRWYNQEIGAYDWEKPSTYFKNGTDLREKTRENSLYLSVGAQFNHPQLTTVYAWFKKGLRFLSLDGEADVDPIATLQLSRIPAHGQKIATLLHEADTGIVRFHFNPREIQINPDEAKKLVSAHFPDDTFNADAPISLKSIEIEFGHLSDQNEIVPLDYFSEESAGTRRFFSLAGPWIDILENGYTVFIDEIDTSLHPLLVKQLLRLVFSKGTNSRGAQIVFTTHNPIFLDTSLLRRDQIWFTEKSADGVTHLYPLTDFKPRKDEAIAKGYLAGRYGGVPFIPEGLKL